MHRFPEDIPVILASGSPRRQELLASIDVNFTVIKPDVDESSFDTAHLTPGQLVEFLAQKKADAVAMLPETDSKALVIGSDTVVAMEGTVFGKPKDSNHAFQMLKKLQNSTHQVLSGIALCYQNRRFSSHGVTQVTFVPMTDEEIGQYIETGEPMDKAGAYAIQGYASLFIPRIEGCYFNVVGLPLHLLNRCVKTFVRGH